MKLTLDVVFKNQKDLTEAIQERIKVSISDDKEYWKNVLSYCQKTFPKELERMI